MKRLLISLIAVAAAMTTVPSCVEVQPESDGTGYLNLNVEKDAPNDTIYVSPNTKGAETEDRKIGIKIYDNVGDLVHEAEDYTAMGTLELRTGYYRAVAFSGENPTGASFDSPYYSGEQNFSIRRGQTETLDITCRLANIKVTVTLDPKIIEKFSEYKFTVTGNENSVLEYNQDLANFSREGYFPAAVTELTWELALVSKTGIAYNTLSGTYENVKPCQHYRFNFTLKEEEPSTDIGGSIFTIILDDSLNQKEYDINLDFGKKTPVISAGDQNLDNLEHYDGDPCSISISSESHIESLVISHDDQALETAGLQRSVELAGAGADLLSELSAIGIVTDGIVSQIATKADGNPESASIDFSEFLSSLPEGRYTLNINVTNGDGAAETAMNVNVLGKRPSAVINAVSAEEVWAMFAKVKATYISQGNPEGLGFRYKAADADTWTEVAAASHDGASSTFTAEIRGLQPSQSYVIKAICSDAEGPETSFTTESAAVVPNMNFNDWYLDGKIWFPGVSSDNCFWDTANKGSATLNIFPTTPEESNVVSGKAAKLESKKVAVVGLAAGNIYTGKFIKAIVNLQNPGAQLDWGIPFTSRPLALKGHYKYEPKTIDQAKAPYDNMKGQMDIGQIQIMLTDWDAPFRVDTQEKTFVNVNDSHILGYGTMDINATSEYQEFTINVDYRNRTKTPTHIVIVAAASKYGDYFTGGAGSTLYLDEFELVYDPEQLN
ncbi:MAG: PCMD domain-containing protein [Bacteroidales bacterium]|nr:PCMD domain-containing protein [Bacteroidales bacterium]